MLFTYSAITFFTILSQVYTLSHLCQPLLNCHLCTPTGICIQCLPSYKLDAGRCFQNPQKNQPISQHSQSGGQRQLRRLQQSAKLKEEKQYFRFGSAGIDSGQRCLFQWKGACVLCGYNYQFSVGGECIQRFDECLKFQEYLCTKCDSKFKLRNGQCMDAGCSSQNYYHCSQCKNGYTLNKYGHCQIQHCNSYRQSQCQSCQPPYILINSLCILPIQNCESQNQKTCQKCSPSYHYQPKTNQCLLSSPLCSSYNAQGLCQQCNYPQLMLQNGRCVDINCLAFQNDGTGQCVNCAVGYVVREKEKGKGKICILDFQDENCVRVNVNVCLNCKDGYFIDQNGRCKVLPENCIEKTCQYCKKGYISINNKCMSFQNCQNVSPNNYCIVCKEGHSLTNIGTCIKSVGICLEYSHTGCIKCPPNYNLSPSTSPSSTTPPSNTPSSSTPFSASCRWNPSYKDPSCLANNYKNQCVLCRNGYRLVPKYNNLCLQINTQCKTSNNEGQCTSCYEGYQLNKFMGSCVQALPILNCALQNQGKCIRCSDRFYLVSGACKEVDALCKDYHRNFGYCTQCYDGYVLTGQTCQIPPAITSHPTPALLGSSKPLPLSSSLINCRTFSPTNSQICIKCFDSYYLLNNSCQRIDPLCKTFNETINSCTKCYEGYRIVGKSCKLENAQNQTLYALNCKKSDHAKKECLECVDRYYKDGNGCKQVNRYCSTFDKSSGACLTCYPGYIIFKNTCITLSSLSSLSQPLQNCQKQSETMPTICQQCTNGYYWSKDHCEKASILCGTSNSKGECLTCIQGYFKNELNQCIMAALGFDQNCQVYDVNGYCKSCKKKFKLQNFLCI